ncbi:MAG: hypothetical protein C4538_10215 [Nitrospiraceae bacterium]|nr:MAG: hypothetical protein C4538_10215 [Nitrospiraceae bacterium]
MVVASGFVEAAGKNNIDAIVKEMERRSMDVSDIVTDKAFFLFRRETIDAMKEEVEFLRRIENVRNVHLTYYSIE